VISVGDKCAAKYANCSDQIDCIVASPLPNEAAIDPKRLRDSHSGFRTERENLHSDAKGKGASGANREAESTDAPVRGGLPRSSDEAGYRPRSEGAGYRHWRGSTDHGMNPINQWKEAAFARWNEPYESRGSRRVL
jgi:hypothetical protein